jgi:parallel beta-helix repeat protein
MNIRVHLQGIMGLICGVALLGSLVHAQKSEAKTYYVATDGSDSNSGTEKQPFQTLSRGILDLGPGDTLYVKNGTYESWGLYGPPSGASWNNPVTIAAYPGHSPVIVKPDQFPHVLQFANDRYIVIDGFVIDGTNAIEGVKITFETSGGIADHIRIQNSEISNAAANGIFMTPGSDGNEFIHLEVHNNGITDFDHGIYIGSSDNIVKDCSIHDNAGWGVHLHSSSGGVNNNIIRGNNIYNNGKSGIRGSGIVLGSGSGNQAYNNIVWGNMGGIHISDASDTYVGNNTVYGNTDFGIDIGFGSFNARIEFNSVYDNDGPSIADYGVSTRILP